jgi:hypothetical protein
MMSEGQYSSAGFSALRRFAKRADQSVDKCELCSLALGRDHSHLIELSQRRLICACDACALLFGGPSKKYRRVPRRIQAFPNFQLSDAEWNGLMVPINMVFFFNNSVENRVIALYPSPAGATESLLELESWNDIVAHNPALNGMEPDVEALLVNRLGYSRGYSAPEYYQLPIDECYKLVGLIRAHWSGLSGGSEVWQQIGEFFRSIRERAVVVEAAPVGSATANGIGAEPPVEQAWPTADAVPAEEEWRA